MSLRKAFLLFWVGGLVLFAGVLAMHTPLVIDAVPGGIGAHQAAGDARTVNEIQSAWAAAGVMDSARWAMTGDLIFIGVYGLGSLLGGWYYWRTGRGVVAVIGMVVAIAAIIFTVTDYAETIAQIIQLVRERGGDRLAGLAAGVRPTKMAAFVVTFLGVIIAFILRRLFGRGAASPRA